MSQRILYNILVLIVLLVSCKKEKLPEISFSEIENFHSQTVNDNYKIYYFLPNDYSDDTKHPVILLLDGDFYAERMAQEISLLWNENLIPRCILVGIGNSDNRVRDYTYPVDKKYNNSSGHADIFYSFLTSELMPHIENKFSVDTNAYLLLGHSLGGFFTLYSMFKDNITGSKNFAGIIAASPSVRWSNGYLFGLEQDLANQTNAVDCNLFLSSGSDEGVVYNVLAIEIYERLKNRNYSDFKIEYHNYKGEPHDGTPIPSFVDGLIFHFNNL